MYEETVNLLEGNIGNEIRITGTISEVIWQHFQIHLDSHPNINYFDFEDGFQVVAYSKEPISCNKKVEIFAKVKKIEKKKEARSNTKIREGYAEYYLIVDSWNCVD
ncbi:MAG: hypothetical protein ACOC44_13695 [Promethearchaeia archaeon]